MGSNYRAILNCEKGVIRKEAMEVEQISLSTTPVFLAKGDTVVSQGTGFFYLYLHRNLNLKILYLVTSYHVLTGSRPSEQKPPQGDSITFQFHRSEAVPGDIKNVHLPLFTKDEKPRWITSSSCPEADLAVIPLLNSLYNGCDIKALSPEWAEKGDVKIRPAMTVTLVGYPDGFYDKTNALPVWQTGSVASEPEIDFDAKPLFLIDASAVPGMSGAPVFAISYGTYQRKNGSIKGEVQKFLGIYAHASGKPRDKEKYLELEESHDKKSGLVESEALTIGYVWKASLIKQTLDSIDFDQYNKEILVNFM
jgi:hypothetical protein